MLREELNLSQAELASAMGVNRNNRFLEQITILVCRRSSVMSRHWVVNLALMLSYLQVKESRSMCE
jgi:transcriptional regulator with XRE-family HTH domain